MAFFRLVVTLAEVGAALPKCADLAARGVYAPDPKVLATFSHLPCDIRDGDNSQINFSKQDILKLHSFPPAASVSESVSAILFDFDPIIDRPPSPEAERHQRGRGRGRGRRGRGGSAPGGRGSRGAGRQSQRGGGGPAPQEADAPVAGDDVKLLPGRAQQLRAQYKAEFDKLQVGRVLQIPGLTKQMREMAHDAAASVRPTHAGKLQTWSSGDFPHRVFHAFKPKFSGDRFPGAPPPAEAQPAPPPAPPSPPAPPAQPVTPSPVPEDAASAGSALLKRLLKRPSADTGEGRSVRRRPAAAEAASDCECHGATLQPQDWQASRYVVE